MSTFIKGDNVILSLWDGTSSYFDIACLTNNEISFTRSLIESQTKCSSGIISIASGSTSSEVSFDAIYIKEEDNKTTFNDLFNFINVSNGTTKDWRMTSDQLDPYAYYGNAVLSGLTLTSSAGDEFVTFSGTLSNNGLITKLSIYVTNIYDAYVARALADGGVASSEACLRRYIETIL